MYDAEKSAKLWGKIIKNGVKMKKILLQLVFDPHRVGFWLTNSINSMNLKIIYNEVFQKLDYNNLNMRFRFFLTRFLADMPSVLGVS